MKKLFVCLVAVLSTGVFAQIRNLVVPTEAIGQQAFQERSDQIARNRQVVVKELMDFGDSAAKAGIAYSADEWRKLAAEFAGSAWSPNMPSQDILDMTLRAQNAKARKDK